MIQPLRTAVARGAGRLAAERLMRRPAQRFDAPPYAFAALMRRLASDCHSVLDIGTGLMHSLRTSPCPVRLGLDAHRPYLEQRVVREAVPINASALDIERLFVPGAVDLITLIDVVEHFTPQDAREVLRQAETVGARRTVLFTPRGEFPQSGFDAFGLGGEEYQRHRSSWEPEDFLAMGYRVAVLKGFHGPSNASFVEAFGRDAPPVDALVVWKDAR